MSNRNTEAHFSLAPQVEIERSTFDRSTNIKTSFDVGRLIPFFVDEVLPGDTFQITTSKVARLQSLIAPVMDNLYLDTYYFFVPNRLVWNSWKNFCGESTNAWIPDGDYVIPQIRFPLTDTGWSPGTIADYMGLPVGVNVDEQDLNTNTVSALPFRAYTKIVNDWFRDENLMAEFLIDMGSTTTTGTNDDFIDSNGIFKYNTLQKGGMPFIACKFHDRFTSCLPAPQRGEDVPFISGLVPVITNDVAVLGTDGAPYNDMSFADVLTGTPITNFRNFNADGYGAYVGPTGSGEIPDDDMYYVLPNNLVADLSRTISGRTTPGFDYWSSPISINSLRQAFQIQRMLEKDARGGTRYIEILKTHFGVTSPDYRLQRSEYLGGNRVPLNIEQVVQTSSTDSTSPQGNVAGWSQTNDTNYDVEKSFTEHGFVIGLMVARYDHTYCQGVEPFWRRRTRYDYYWPALAHLGEQAVMKEELFFPAAGDVFGYQEAWSEYRYKPNYVTGLMRPNISNNLAIWNFADNYEQTPYLSANWIIEDKKNVDRTLAVTSELSNQIIIDIYVQNRCTRPMPLYSIPGLIDHF